MCNGQNFLILNFTNLVEDAIPATRPRIRGRRWMDGKLRDTPKELQL